MRVCACVPVCVCSQKEKSKLLKYEICCRIARQQNYKNQLCDEALLPKSISCIPAFRACARITDTTCSTGELTSTQQNPQDNFHISFIPCLLCILVVF